MTSTRMFLALAAATSLFAGPALAVTVSNDSDKEITIGIDRGSSENVQQVAAGKSVNLDCKEGCGVTGPWGFSWMAQGNDSFKTNGRSLNDVHG